MSLAIRSAARVCRSLAAWVAVGATLFRSHPGVLVAADIVAVVVARFAAVWRVGTPLAVIDFSATIAAIGACGHGTVPAMHAALQPIQESAARIGQKGHGHQHQSDQPLAHGSFPKSRYEVKCWRARQRGARHSSAVPSPEIEKIATTGKVCRQQIRCWQPAFWPADPQASKCLTLCLPKLLDLGCPVETSRHGSPEGSTIFWGGKSKDPERKVLCPKPRKNRGLSKPDRKVLSFIFPRDIQERQHSASRF